MLTNITISYNTFEKDICFKRGSIERVGVAVTLQACDWKVPGALVILRFFFVIFLSSSRQVQEFYHYLSQIKSLPVCNSPVIQPSALFISGTDGIIMETTPNRERCKSNGCSQHIQSCYGGSCHFSEVMMYVVNKTNHRNDFVQAFRAM